MPVLFFISSLPGKASRTHVELRDSTAGIKMFLEAESGKLNTKRHKPGILFISLSLGLLF